MRHLDEGALRRLHDEPLAIDERSATHLKGCAGCQARLNTLAVEAAEVRRLMEQAFVPVDARSALSSVRARLEAAEPEPRHFPGQLGLSAIGWRLPKVARPAAVLAAAAALVVVLGVTGAAQNLVKVFEPKKIVAIQVSPTSGGPAHDASYYGSVSWNPAPPKMHEVTAAAAAAYGLPLRTPSSLPASVPRSVTYAAIDRTAGSFTFNTANDPANIRGSILYVTAGPAVATIYGGSLSGAGSESMPQLVIGVMRAPVAYSSGASAKQLEDFLLSQPGLPPDFVTQVRAIKDPTATLPIPIPSGMVSRSVQVQGVSGVLVDGGLGAGVVWETKDGIIYGVAGQLTPDQVLAIARSLH